MYFNEYDAYPAEWLRNLWPAARVDGRSICDVRPEEIEGVRRAHFFAGIGGWEYALQLAGWPTDREVWTGSCPCQPFSAAGKQKAEADERHLWPEFRYLIQECRPATVFGEQVASKLGREWLSGVRADLEALGYAVGAADLCAAGVGAPHIRQRLYWVADAADANGRRGERAAQEGTRADAERRRGLAGGGTHGGLADPMLAGRAEWWTGPRIRPAPWCGVPLRCDDGKWRRVPATEAGELEPGLFPLAHGVSNRIGKLRAYGNAIVPQQAASFIQAFLETEVEALI